MCALCKLDYSEKKYIFHMSFIFKSCLNICLLEIMVGRSACKRHVVDLGLR